MFYLNAGGLSYYESDNRLFKRNFLINPVKDTIYVKDIPASAKVLKSGLSALSEKTILGQPNHEVYTAPQSWRSKFEDFIITKEEAEKNGFPEIQLAKYDIILLTKDSCVDPVTLIAGLKEYDDRIQIAIEEMMEDVEWFEA